MTKDIQLFLEEAIRLKRMVRSGWLYSGVSKTDVESVADHSYFVGIISLLLALNEQKNNKEINLQKVLLMALLHDLPEAVSQDIDRRVRKFAPKKYDTFKKKLDVKAFEYLANLLPSEHKQYFLEIFDEFTKQESIEAKLVKEADRLETLMQLKEYINQGYNRELFTEFFTNFTDEKNSYQFEIVKKLTTEILENEE